MRHDPSAARIRAHGRGVTISRRPCVAAALSAESARNPRPRPVRAMQPELADGCLRAHDERGAPACRAAVSGREIMDYAARGHSAGASAAHGSEKVAGYGRPVKVVLQDRAGRRRALVWRTASPNEFGHDRRADRAAEMIEAYDDFALVPRHVTAVDLGVIAADGALASVHGAGETYLVTTYASGTTYAEDLRRIAADGSPASSIGCAAMRSRATSPSCTRRSPTARCATGARSETSWVTAKASSASSMAIPRTSRRRPPNGCTRSRRAARTGAGDCAVATID